MATDALYSTLRHFADATNDLVCSTPEFVLRRPTKKLCDRDQQAGSSSVATSTSLSHLQEPTLRPKLPMEILDAIFLLLPHDHLKPLLFTNSFISALAARRLYHTVHLGIPSTIIQFLKGIVKKPELASLVRVLDLHINPYTPISNFYTLLHRALLLTTGLTSLFLELPKTHSPLWIFDRCTFKLRQFTTSMYCRRPLASFLEAQSSIVDLTLRGYQTDSVFFLPFIDPLPPSMQVPNADAFILSPEALPRLRSFNAVHADACIVQAVVQGRPVQVVSIPLFSEMSVAALDALKMSTASLKRLSVISFDPTAPSFLFEALAQRFEELEALHLVMLMAEYSNELLEQSANILSRFKCLKYITFMAAPPPMVQPANVANGNVTPATEEDEGRIAKMWHRACPTLRTIILPKGKVWFQNSPAPSATATTAHGVGNTSTASVQTVTTPSETSTEAGGGGAIAQSASGSDSNADASDDSNGPGMVYIGDAQSFEQDMLDAVVSENAYNGSSNTNNDVQWSHL
ncbi:hypothetical protein JR316_0003227 [Psilocybe cubensis]|uniref:Uncharacterized protein n=2 Tax=Psilocybe cubensis TaxID=181762 RepID=A0ACB8H7A7_PSICU|nr:hypothetical protein JR316_0003227 [Psilocybe cubensis]KAH9483751.1 hypothetical protein JR316_0003227 [Psilocybe cubensis]